MVIVNKIGTNRALVLGKAGLNCVVTMHLSLQELRPLVQKKYVVFLAQSGQIGAIVDCSSTLNPQS